MISVNSLAIQESITEVSKGSLVMQVNMVRGLISRLYIWSSYAGQHGQRLILHLYFDLAED
jgi:hypothetical protein